MERLQDRIRDHLIGEADYDVRKPRRRFGASHTRLPRSGVGSENGPAELDESIDAAMNGANA